MKIFTRCVYGWQPDGTLKLEESESFDYEGPVALCKDSPDPPAPPDYAGAARATNESSRVNQYTPFGNLTWTPGQEGGLPILTPMPGGLSGITGYTQAIPWESKVTLAPDAQRALDAQMKTGASMAEGANQVLLPRAAEEFSRPADLSSVQDIADKAYAAQTSRLDPQWRQNEEMQRTQLTNQGLVPGGEAYDNAMRIFGNSKNDAYQQAIMGSINTMPQTYQLATAARNAPLNELNAVNSGAQITNPQFSGVGQGADMLGAAQAAGQYGQGLYGAQVGETNAQNANTTAAASAAAMIAVMI